MNESIADTINNPVKVYFLNDVHYVAVDTVTDIVIQISDLTREIWQFTPGDFSQ